MAQRNNRSSCQFNTRTPFIKLSYGHAEVLAVVVVVVLVLVVLLKLTVPHAPIPTYLVTR
ncbi:hypothetical protein E2C01_030527 [Portunus trituberculatus]|uniref:Uncharacterized protein n=1 Tax=Portunus trituberculatus TaxID=210409 RepID=A0A5B7EXK3_PORTR|nr:hypothetical protein [Portunus trituberculatus]